MPAGDEPDALDELDDPRFVAVERTRYSGCAPACDEVACCPTRAALSTLRYRWSADEATFLAEANPEG